MSLTDCIGSSFSEKKKLPPMSGTATPSEVFHRNLVDAVSNVEGIRKMNWIVINVLIDIFYRL